MHNRFSQLLLPFYQPVMGPAGTPVYFEALMRTYAASETRDLHRRLLEVAEEAGFIDEIDCVIAQQALAAAVEAGVAVGLNVSAFTIQNALEDFLGVLKRRASGQPLVVELTETLQPDRSDLMHRFVEEARSIGAQIAIDDYGDGHFEAADIGFLAPDFVKLAMARVKNLSCSSGRQWLGDAVALANGVGADIVAEGVEDEATRALLSSMGVRLFQGHLWGLPSHLLPRAKDPPDWPTAARAGVRRGYVATPLS